MTDTIQHMQAGKRLAEALKEAGPIAVLTGAGISAESGVPTFRGPEGLWEKYRAEDLATPEAFQADPGLVWRWYDWRRTKISGLKPNAGHLALARWESLFPGFTLITQNVDGLHAAAGSRRILELHGNIWKVRCTREGTVFDNTETPLGTIPPLCPDCGALLRPHIVWFGEGLDPDILGDAFRVSERCSLMLVVGTSAVVHPAASLPLAAASAGAQVVEINPDPTSLSSQAHLYLQGPAAGILGAADRILGAGSGPHPGGNG